MALIDRSLGYVPAKKAWKASGKADTGHVPAEPKENIQVCLTCEKPSESCRGCPNGQDRKKLGRPTKYDPEVLLDMMRAGCRQREIAAAFGVADSTVSIWVKRLKEDKAREY
jgi:hypothetical protein